MGTALVYILSSTTLAIILALTRSRGHSIVGGEDVFRYRPKLLKVLYGCAFAPVACATFIDVVAEPKPGVTAVALTMCAALLASSLVLWLWKGNAGQDEFDTLGLGNHRETHRWADAFASK